jgi:phosphocarrier protein
LRKSPYFALRDVCCAYHDGVLTLRGFLPSYYLKQLAQSMVGDVEGVLRVVNEIEVATALHREPPGRFESQASLAVITREVQIENGVGLHLRAAGKFVRVAQQYQSRIRVRQGEKLVDGKSILELTTLAAEGGTWLAIIADGPDAHESLNALCALVKDGFGEQESEA